MRFSNYKNAHQEKICAVFEKTFSDSEGPAEGGVIGKLVNDLTNESLDNDVFGFIALEEEQIVGGIFFSRLVFEDNSEVFLLAPVAVHPDFQGKGVGQGLINYGLEKMHNRGIQLVFTYGDPAYYSRVGFKQISEDIAKAPFELSQPVGWLCQSLDASQIEPLAGVSRCVKAFAKAEYW